MAIFISYAYVVMVAGFLVICNSFLEFIHATFWNRYPELPERLKEIVKVGVSVTNLACIRVRGDMGSTKETPAMSSRGSGDSIAKWSSGVSPG